VCRAPGLEGRKVKAPSPKQNSTCKNQEKVKKSISSPSPELLSIYASKAHTIVYRANATCMKCPSVKSMIPETLSMAFPDADNSPYVL
jgi:hypothetical protein